MLSFFKNGKEIKGSEFGRVRGLVYPVVSVDKGAALKFVFHESEFAHSPPSAKYPPLMETRDMI